MHIDEFDYRLPPELIAHVPAGERDNSRLMVIHRQSGGIEHRRFSDLNEYLGSGDVLVVNNTKVRAARLFGRKETGGRVEVLLLEQCHSSEPEPSVRDHVWEALIHGRRKLHAGTDIAIGPDLKAELLEHKQGGLWLIRLESQGPLEELIERYGRTPLPPYIKADGPEREKHDRDRYQTIFACKTGSAAAPTAGLHFTGHLVEQLKRQGVTILTITLHVGLGTFQPVRSERIENHRMHREYYEVDTLTAERIRSALRTGKRIVGCGTTSVRVLETLKHDGASLQGYTDLFIYPGYRFNSLGAMITNFHLPKSTLLMLVAAFAGKDLVFQAYREAIARKYRFYSYGDAMLIV